MPDIAANTEPEAALAEDRGVLALHGPDRVAFLQGLVSNDVAKVSAGRAVWAALLTPQGKYLHDFFLVAAGETLLLDCEAARRDDLLRRLKLYRLRSMVELADRSADLAVALAWGGDICARLGLAREPGSATPFADGFAFVDPRLAALGARLILPRAEAAATLAAAGLRVGRLEDWDALRLAAGVPDGSRDLEVEKSILLENGFDELGGVDWQKGCWMGQELTARTKYRALIRKRLLPVTLAGAAPAPGTAVLQGTKPVGELRSAAAGRALALLRLEALDSAEPLTAGEAKVTVERPDWLALPEATR